MSEKQDELTVSLWRGGKSGSYQFYRVPRRENQTVLDVVTFVQRHLDPTLAYRFSCRVGMCGSFAMTVNDFGNVRFIATIGHAARMSRKLRRAGGCRSGRLKTFQ